MRNSSSDAALSDMVPGGVLASDEFVDLTFKPARGERWRKVTIRPVMVKGNRRLQFSYLDERQDTTSNHQLAEAERRLADLLDLPFRSLVVRTTAEDITVKRSKSGRPLVSRSAAPGGRAPALAHDRRKDVPLPAGVPDPLLIALGVMDADGRVRPSMHDKHAQVNQFLQLLEQGLKDLDLPSDRPLRIVDLGCGSSYLTFAAYHYLNDVRGLPATVVGVDAESKLIAKCTRQCADLGYDALRFQQSAILDYEPDEAPDVVLALHACDTATDDALAHAVRWQAGLILAAPCCHKELNRRLETAALKSLFRYGLLKQRTADIVTDAFRAQLLRLMGYGTEVIEFVPAEHTAKNLMIRAVKARAAGDPKVRREYEDMKAFWGATPYLEGLLPLPPATPTG